MTFIVGVLLPELVIDLLLLQSRMPDQVSKLSEITSLNTLLNVLDEFNLLASDASKEDESDMTWPEGIIGITIFCKPIKRNALKFIKICHYSFSNQ